MLRCVSQRNRLRGFTGLNSTCSDINIAVGLEGMEKVCITATSIHGIDRYLNASSLHTKGVTGR